MKNTGLFDVLIVYTNHVASSAAHLSDENITPFSLSPGREHYGVSYAYFLEKCFKAGLRAAFTTSEDIIGPGKCKNYWIYEDKAWKRVQEEGFSNLIFDKFSPISNDLKQKRDLLFSGGISHPFNDSSLLLLFNDKLKTFKKLSTFTIPTVTISSNTIALSLEALKIQISNHQNKKDFSQSVVLKDRFGAGGLNIYKIDKNNFSKIPKIFKENPGISFILQPFTKFDKGYSLEDKRERTDIRIIYSQGKIVQRYIRTAKENDFRCNEHQGGKVTYIRPQHIPKNVTVVANSIMGILGGKNSLFALDFIISNDGNVYFLEGNMNPGIYWGIDSKEDKINTKKLIGIIVKELKRRSDMEKLKGEVIHPTYLKRGLETGLSARVTFTPPPRSATLLP